MKDASRYVKVDDRKKLEVRSNGFCECCGTDLPPDRHHILEFSQGGLTDTANLIVVCQSCHKQLPLYLNEAQQHALQTWRKDQVGPNKSASHQVSTPLNSFVLGSNTFSDCGSVLRINGQNILTPRLVNGRFYTNVVMLDPQFEDQLLVLGNRVIKNKSSSITVDDNSLTLEAKGKRIFKIYKRDGQTHIDLRINYDGREFIFDERQAVYPGMSMTGCVFAGCSAAIVYNFDNNSWNCGLCS
jgi:HNH endonuclease